MVDETTSREDTTVKPKSTRSRSSTKSRKVDVIQESFGSIASSLSVSSIRETDDALRELVSCYNEIASAHSTYPEITSDDTLADLVAYSKQLTFEQQIKLAHTFLYYSGRISDELTYRRRLQDTRHKFMVWGGILFGTTSLAMIISVIVVAIMRNQIDANVYTQWLVDIFTMLSKIILNDASTLE